MPSSSGKRRPRSYDREEPDGDHGGTPIRATVGTGTHPKLVTPTKAETDSDENHKTALVGCSEEYPVSAFDTASHWQTVFGVQRRVTTVPPAVHRAYRDSQRHVRRLGDGDASDPVNGEFTPGSVQRLLQELLWTARLGEGPASVLADIGSGTGKVVMHAAACVPSLRAMGVEVSQTRHLISLLCHRDALMRHEEYSHRIFFKRADVLDLTDLGEVSHLYMASAAFPDLLMFHLAKLWNRSHTAEYLVCNHDPRHVIGNYNFNVEDLEVKVSCKMHGSGEGKTFYFYRRSRMHDDETVPSVKPADILLTGDELASLNADNRNARLEIIKEIITNFQNEPTPKRVRRGIRYTS